MTRFKFVFAVLAVLAASATASAVDPIFYFDVNDTAAGSGIDPDGLYTWDTVATNFKWNPNAAGTDPTVAWVNGKDAVFSAGNDFTDEYFGLDVAAATTANSVLVKAGSYLTLKLSTAGIDTGTGNITVGEGVGQGAILEVGNSPTTKLNAAGKLILHGGTYRMVTVQTVGHSFLSATKSLEINGEGTIDHQEGGAATGGGRVAIYAPSGTNTILGTGGTTANGGAGTLNITGTSGEIRFQGTGLPLSTFAKLKVGTGMLYRLGNAASIIDERGFGAVPLAPLADAITLDGGSIGNSFTVTLHANRGITLGAGGGWFNQSAATMTVPSIVSGVGSLNKDVDGANLVKGTATSAGLLNLSSTTGNTYQGGSNINAGTVRVFNTSGSGTGTGPVVLGGSSTTQFGTFGGTGSVSGLTTLNQFGEIRPGGTSSTDNAGTLTLNGGLTLNAGSLLTYQMGPTGNDKTVIGGVNGLNIAGAMSMVILANGTIAAAGQFPVLDYDTSFLGSLSDIALNTAALAPGFTYSLVNNLASTSIDFKITGAAGLLGDFNNDTKVDAGDYATWRKNDLNAALPNDNGLASQADRFNLWRANFGNPPGAGSGGGLSNAAVPEPTSICLLLSSLAIVAAGRRRAR